MKRSDLEMYLGKNVKITLFDDTIVNGELHKTGEEMFKNNPNLYLPRNRYFVINPFCHLIFRCSHVKKLEVL